MFLSVDWLSNFNKLLVIMFCIIVSPLSVDQLLNCRKLLLIMVGVGALFLQL